MRLLVANKILLGAAAVVVPGKSSIYYGLTLKEKSLVNQIERIPDGSQLKTDRAMRARIVQLSQERAELLAESAEVDRKLGDVRKRAANAQPAPSA
ncbi:uncharacterized protein EHS24_006824 [Apiotrichum porosum]|uniref:Uncharacterized protein n=1 Tax=Apiotrichum porosum TaxID=105984 RepID=A0A427XWR8_9TREE|nr:uncharacterized protein EHS24_006824 [Apiotrichum porosum]RSH83165.1 hypothetical protein EHS24_006824 [Apiotrichum porosum]